MSGFVVALLFVKLPSTSYNGPWLRGRDAGAEFSSGAQRAEMVALNANHDNSDIQLG